MLSQTILFGSIIQGMVVKLRYVYISEYISMLQANSFQDLDGDESDGMDEVIYPMDHEAAGHIVDDEMWEIMVRPLPIGCRLTVCLVYPIAKPDTYRSEKAIFDVGKGANIYLLLTCHTVMPLWISARSAVYILY